jgi:hypothetical protein
MLWKDNQSCLQANIWAWVPYDEFGLQESKVDACHKCDTLHMKMQVEWHYQEKKFEDELHLHQAEAEMMLQKMR